MLFRVWFYLNRLRPWFWLAAVLLLFAVPDAPSMPLIFLTLVGLGLVIWLTSRWMVRGGLSMACPFCGEKGRVQSAKRFGWQLYCQGCGLVRAGSPSSWILRRSRRRFCGHCGYDLRATTGRCPECGFAVPV